MLSVSPDIRLGSALFELCDLSEDTETKPHFLYLYNNAHDDSNTCLLGRL